MLSPRQNFLETLKKDGKPDRLVNQYEALSIFVGDPVAAYVRGKRYRGMPPTKDRWGTTIVWPEDQYSTMPHVTETDKVLKDITKWNELKVPDILGNCSDPALWEPALEKISSIDRENILFTPLLPTGLFEQLHFLMGFEDTLVNFLLEPESMHELCRIIGDYRYNYAKLVVDSLKPDVILSHDDWGSKSNLFMSPDVWREFIKPQYAKMYTYMKERGIVVIHHADSFLEPIVEDMLELGVDAWQGVLPQNDIPKIQKQLDGRMALMGGIDAAIVDRADATEAEIRAETRRVCVEYASAGHFIPCITYGAVGNMYPHVDPIISDEINKYNQESFG